MNRVVSVLAAVAAGLTALVLAEFFMPLGGGDASLAPTTARPDAERAMAQGGPTDFIAAILARPLFRPDRRPAPGDARGLNAGGPADLPRLTAILLTTEEKRAIFQPSGKEPPIVVVEGDTVGNWRVEQIAVDAVTLTGPGGTRRVEPKFSNSPPSGVPFQPLPPAIAGAGGQPNGGPGQPQGKR
jgi:general secretion pathway protein N